MIHWFNLLERLVDWNCGNVILTRTPNILQFGWRIDRRPMKQNYNESLAISLLEILCSSDVLHLRRYMVEVLQSFWGLNLYSFSDLWFVEVSGGFWDWFQQTLRSRQVVWMALLWMFFNFEVEVLEGLEAWFPVKLQYFWVLLNLLWCC